jgi:hypothetical protein
MIKRVLGCSSGVSCFVYYYDDYLYLIFLISVTLDDVWMVYWIFKIVPGTRFVLLNKREFAL